MSLPTRIGNTLWSSRIRGNRMERFGLSADVLWHCSGYFLMVFFIVVRGELESSALATGGLL